MFGFCNSCKTQPAGPGYIVQKSNQAPKFYTKYDDIKEHQLNDHQTSIYKVNKSSIGTQSANNISKDKVFVDPDFSPDQHSLGKFKEINIDKWKRISDIVQKPQLFPEDIQPKSTVLNGYQKDYAFMAATAALAQNNQRLKNIFGKQTFQPKGAYTILLRFKGQIKEVVIDDFVPVNEHGQPIFSKPYNNNVGVMLLEKARAKLYGSYEKMIWNSKSIKSCWQDITFAPSVSYKTLNTNSEDLWDKIFHATKFKQICSGFTSNSEKVNWNAINLTPNHYYTIIDAQVLVHKLGSSFKVLKMRNAFKNEFYKGQGSQADTLFWEQVEGNEQKSKILSSVGSKQGIFYMLYTDYLKYFDETFVNLAEDNKKYYNQQLKFSNRGLVYELGVKTQGYYTITLDQHDMRAEKQKVYIDQGWSRSTVIIIKNNSTNVLSDYEYVDGIFKYNQQQVTLKAPLTPGKYILYLKLDPTIDNKNFPLKSNLIVYSLYSVTLSERSQKQYPELLKKVFSAYGRNFKRQFYNNDLMWSSWKLISQSGYAYISFGNASQSQSKFVITLDQEVFKKQNYIMKKPFKGKGSQMIEVLPGKQEIILLRICNSKIREINFPPPIDIKILPVS